jgi:hypothetical protein
MANELNDEALLTAYRVFNSWYWPRLTRAQQINVCKIIYRDQTDLWVFTRMTYR